MLIAGATRDRFESMGYPCRLRPVRSACLCREEGAVRVVRWNPEGSNKVNAFASDDAAATSGEVHEPSLAMFEA